MKVMISLPMNGHSDEDVKKRMDILKKQFANMHIEVIDSFLNVPADESVRNEHVFYLGRSIMMFLAHADAVYFDNGWEQARGCKIEHEVCKQYGIKTLYSNFFDFEEKQSTPGGSVRIYTPTPNETKIVGITYSDSNDISVQDRGY